MKQAKLQFHSLEDLWTFKAKVNAQNITIIAMDAILVATLSDKDILFAQTFFRAKKLDGKLNRFF